MRENQFDFEIQIQEEKKDNQKESDKIYLNESSINNNLEILETYKEIKTYQIILLNISATFGPFLVVLLFLFQLDQIILTQLVYQILVLIMVPLIYHKLEIIKLDYKKIMASYFLNLKNQLVWGFIGLLFCAGGLIGTYLIIYDIDKDLVKFREINLAQNFISVFSFIILMGLTNPFLEEVFWRIFLQKSNEIYFVQQKSTIFTPNVVSCIVSLEFGFYHLFVVAFFSSYYKGILFYFVISFSGRILHWIQNKFGFFTSFLIHVGADIAVIVIALLIVYKIQQDKELFLMAHENNLQSYNNYRHHQLHYYK